MCTKALAGDEIRELRRLAYVFLCHREDIMGVDPKLVSVSAGLPQFCRRTLSSQVF